MRALLAPLLVAVLLGGMATAVRADPAGYVYAYALHDSHTGQTFYSGDALKPFGAPLPFRPYVELLLQRESRSDGTPIPQILNDNYGLVAGGVQYQGGRGFRAFAQIGQAFAFGPQLPTAWSLGNSDFRGGLELFRSWNDGHHQIGSMFASSIYYSRYRNDIVFAQAERGYEVGPSDRPLQVYLRVSGNADSRRFFYNNVVSATVGARYLPLGHLGPSLALEQSYSNFIGPLAPVTAAGDTRQFSSFRPVVSFGTSF